MLPLRLARPLATARPAAAARATAWTRTRALHATRRNAQVHELTSMDDYHRAIEDNEAVVVDCYAAWCQPCKAMAPMVESMSEDPKLKSVHFVKVDVDNVPRVAEELRVRAMPTFVFFRHGALVHEMVGADPTRLMAQVKKLADGDAQGLSTKKL